MSTPTCVYRCWDAAGVLLYVGSTAGVAQRLSQHFSTSCHAANLLGVSVSSLFNQNEVAA